MSSKKVIAIKTFISELREDIQGYTQLQQLLDSQHKAMIKRDSRSLQSLSKHHNVLLSQLNARALHRSELLKVFGLPDNAMGVSKLINALPDEYANKVLTLWNELQTLVHACMRNNERNSKLLNMQHQIMTQVTQPEQPQTYEPA
ncbi:flagellar export chaperone FlgN [Thaumasiovibrio sp. DFM-14]|uniref:flagellar export chaperone FlgN n=1 Tax=Thaumasiovibrio sp. DFM-14 TaxID=3384792 RepID=UPI0039A14CB6